MSATDRTAATGASVAVRDLFKAFGTVKAVDGVSLEIQAGEFVALLGPSGSGKTTILMSIAGFETPDAGEILIAGRDIIPEPPNKRDVGMVFQRYALFPHMTVAQNIAFPLKMRKVPKDKRKARVEQALDLVRLPGYGERRINQLSGGQQQRVALARAVVFDPPVLLMDEPLGALDKRLREEMQIELKHIQQQLRTTVIYVTHDQSEALTMADRIAVLHEGHLQQYAPPQEVYDQPSNAFVAGFVGETNFIEGTLLKDGSSWQFSLGAGDAVGIDPSADDGWSDGAAATIAVRPETISIVPDGATGGVSGVVAETIYGGGTVACIIKLATGQTITVQEESLEGSLRRAGDAVRATWPAKRNRVFLK